jgi:hypothetical protein
MDWIVIQAHTTTTANKGTSARYFIRLPTVDEANDGHVGWQLIEINLIALTVIVAVLLYCKAVPEVYSNTSRIGFLVIKKFQDPIRWFHAGLLAGIPNSLHLLPNFVWWMESNNMR